MDYGKEVSTLISRLTDSSRYDKQIRPNFGGTPVMVNITILVNDISQLSEINMVSWEKRSLEICPNGDWLPFRCLNATEPERNVNTNCSNGFQLLKLRKQYVRNELLMLMDIGIPLIVYNSLESVRWL